MKNEALRRKQFEERAHHSEILLGALKKRTEVKFDRLFMKVKGRRYVKVTQVKPELASMNEGDVFVLDCRNVIYVWNGSKANRLEKARGIDIANRIKNKERGGNATVIVVNEEPEKAKEFWEFLDTNGEISEAGPENEDTEYENSCDSNWKLHRFANRDLFDFLKKKHHAELVQKGMLLSLNQAKRRERDCITKCWTVSSLMLLKQIQKSMLGWERKARSSRKQKL